MEKALTPVNYLLRRLPLGKPYVSHVDKLRRCYEVEPDWASPEMVVKPVSPSPLTTGQEPSIDYPENGEDSYRSEEECVARPKRHTRPPERLIEHC